MKKEFGEFVRKFSFFILSLPRENYALSILRISLRRYAKKSIGSAEFTMSLTFNKSLFKLLKWRAARQHFSYFGRHCVLVGYLRESREHARC